MAETTHTTPRDQHRNASPAPRVLVAYASRYGSTAGVAERIGAGLRGRGFRVDVLTVEPALDARGYDAVVFGGAVFGQRWTAEGEEFVWRNLDALTSRPVWLFSVTSFGDGKRLIGPLMKREPKGIDALRAAIGARDYRVFAGVIDRHRWPFASRLLYHAFGGRLGDNRDWPAIDAWTERIAGAVRQPR